MSMTDPIADLFVRIQNGAQRGHAKVQVPASKIKKAILDIFKAEGFIKGYELVTEQGLPAFAVELRYIGGREKKSVINGIRRISKPGCRVYAGKDDIPRVMGGLGVAVLSTPKGVFTGRESQKLCTGGEVLCYIW